MFYCPYPFNPPPVWSEDLPVWLNLILAPIIFTIYLMMFLMALAIVVGFWWLAFHIVKDYFNL